jgi:hypothetical protein
MSALSESAYPKIGSVISGEDQRLDACQAAVDSLMTRIASASAKLDAQGDEKYRAHLTTVQRRVNSGEWTVAKGIAELKKLVPGQSSSWYEAMIS